MRPIRMFTFGLVLTLGLGVGAWALAQETEEQSPPGDAVAQRNSLTGTEKVLSPSGEVVGTMDNANPSVTLPGGVAAQEVFALDGSGRVVGYMTYGDMGFVDSSIARNASEFTKLVGCHDEFRGFIEHRGTLSQDCRDALSRQGWNLSEIGDLPPEGLPTAGPERYGRGAEE